MLQCQEYSIINKLRSRLVIIYLLNVTDLVCTKLLISTGFFIEGNLLMRPIIPGYIGILLKVGLAALLLLWIYYRLGTAKKEQIPITALFINLCLGLYLLINLSHIVWFILLLN